MLSKGMPAAWKASTPPSSRSKILITARTSHDVVSRMRSTALMEEPPVVVTSSRMTMLPPAAIDAPSIPGGCWFYDRRDLSVIFGP